ncbi:MAG: isoprenylcysteine carboxylmethyltransferase family protein [Mariprofundaceae bacterium]|nr:isoprenylcysteine carboxylmethyltransferase family protein [Mariprofundaceae bacterium]
MTEWESAAWIWLSSLIFAVSHSLLAAERCKQWFYRHGLREPRYRLLYSIVAVMATAAWVVYVHQLQDTALYQTDGVVWLAMVCVQVLGLIVALAAFQPIDGLAFLGLRKAKTDCDPFIERGIYRWLRHPMYVGAMLILLAMPEQTWNGLHFALVVCVYFIVGARFEERRMIAQHPDYLAYRQRVPAFIPRF